MALTQELGRFVANLTFEKLPAEAVEIARTGFIDTIATMIAGAHDEAPQLLRKGLQPPPGPASLYFSGETAAAPEAAWINGVAGPACANLRRLDPARATMAIALAASQAGGIMANFGTMTKPFHAGRAAHAGVVSARLAELGFTAAADALEHPQGFLSAVSPEGKADRDGPSPALGEEWHILKQGLSIKKYPACYCTHRALDGMLDLLAQRPLKASEI